MTHIMSEKISRRFAWHNQLVGFLLFVPKSLKSLQLALHSCLDSLKCTCDSIWQKGVVLVSRADVLLTCQRNSVRRKEI